MLPQHVARPGDDWKRQYQQPSERRVRYGHPYRRADDAGGMDAYLPAEAHDPHESGADHVTDQHGREEVQTVQHIQNRQAGEVACHAQQERPFTVLPAVDVAVLVLELDRIMVHYRQRQSHSQNDTGHDGCDAGSPVLYLQAEGDEKNKRDGERRPDGADDPGGLLGLGRKFPLIQGRGVPHHALYLRRIPST